MTEIKQQYTLEELLEIIGDPDELARKIQKDREDWAPFWKIEPHLLEKYPKSGSSSTTVSCEPLALL